MKLRNINLLDPLVFTTAIVGVAVLVGVIVAAWPDAPTEVIAPDGRPALEVTCDSDGECHETARAWCEPCGYSVIGAQRTTVTVLVPIVVGKVIITQPQMVTQTCMTFRCEGKGQCPTPQ